MLACYLAYFLRTRRWQPLMTPAMAVAAILTVPLNSGFEMIRITPTGHLAVLGSFLLFLAGIAYAFIRDKVTKSANEYARAVHDGLTSPIRW